MIFYLTCSTLLQLAALAVIPSLKYTAPGPYAVIFGLFAYYKFDIPASTRVTLLGFEFSDKLVLYALGLQVTQFFQSYLHF